MSLFIIRNYDYSALLFLGGMCKIIQKSYPRVDTYLQRFEKYNNLPLERRKYIIKNFIKSFLLFALSIGLFRPLIWPAIRYNQWNSQLIHITGAIYTSNDVMGLVMVEKSTLQYQNAPYYHYDIMSYLFWSRFSNITFGKNDVCLHICILSSLFGKFLFGS